MKNQRFQSWRLSVNYDWSIHALKFKIKDFNQGGWPQIMPSSAKPGQAQPEALRFSQLKKNKLLGVLATCTNYRKAFTNLSGGPVLPKRRLQKSGIHFFRLPVFT